MLRRLLFLLPLCLPLSCPGHAVGKGEEAVVRIFSHGGSGIIIATGPGWSLILSAAHMFKGGDRNKRVCLDVPTSVPGTVQRHGGQTVLAVWSREDLALVRIAVGPLPYVCPVAPPGHVPGRLVSCGYDEMRLPGRGPQIYPARIVENDGSRTYTAEKPWHGRSGGALIDTDAGYVVGVVSGYECPRGGGGRGIYASHGAILRLLDQHGVQQLARPPPTPQALPGTPAGPLAGPLPRWVIDFPPETRVRNRTGSQCVWSSLETLARKHGIGGARDLTAAHGGSAGPGQVAEVLRRAGVRFEQRTPGSGVQGFINRACRANLGCLVGLNGSHAVVCCGINEDIGKVWIIDNSGPKALQVQEWTLERFKAAWDGWAVVMYPGASAPRLPQPQLAQPRPQPTPGGC